MAELLEKAHKGDPGYEKWLVKYRAFRTAKAAKNDVEASKSEIEKEADAKRNADLSGKSSDKRADDLAAKKKEAAERSQQSAAAEDREDTSEKDEKSDNSDPDAKKLKDKRNLDETEKEIKSQKDSVSAKKKAEVARKFMEKLAAKKG